MNQMVEIDLRAIAYACLRKLWLIILCAVLMGTAVSAFTMFFVTPLYRASATFYVNNSISQNSMITSSDLTTSQKLVATYVNIIKSDTVLEKVAKESGLTISAAQLREIMTAQSVGDTELFKVHISHADPEMATTIANAMATVAPGEISNIVVGSTTKVIDYAKVPNAPYTPNIPKNVMIGVLLGVALALVIIVLQVLLDVNIKGEEDLAAISSIPVLGVIPDFHTDLDDAYTSYGSKMKKKR